MSKRTRIHPIQFYLNDDEQYILEEKYRFWSVLSGLQMYSIALLTVVLIPWIFVTAIFFPPTPVKINCRHIYPKHHTVK